MYLIILLIVGATGIVVGIVANAIIEKLNGKK